MKDMLMIAGLVVIAVGAIWLSVRMGERADEPVEEEALSLDLPEPPPSPIVRDAHGRWHDPRTHRFVKKPADRP